MELKHVSFKCEKNKFAWQFEIKSLYDPILWVHGRRERTQF
jgi:hypothetical protein